MIRFPRTLLVVAIALWCAVDGSSVGLAASIVAASAVPSSLKSLRVEQTATGKPVLLTGRDARQQLCVTGISRAGQMRDLTRGVHYAAEPAGIVEIDATGMVTPLRDGTARVSVTGPERTKTEFSLRVEGCSRQIPINFKNQIVPIFTKLGCNSGGCHGKASGQNGFKLSLLGFVPEDDYEFLVKEGRGRRIFPTAPGESLLLLKPTGRSRWWKADGSGRLRISHVVPLDRAGDAVRQ